ncbi:MAG TPA: two-component regulator propeller domain-containing protein [Bacteroidia bacterium]|jgi:ligand-binding sensor domain-containing protein/serine phosphatase RsbU (regulator of sigma subunit)|nr:two-component regulator propeller domain-containing protein [Bacteroidia bacterium]
MLKRRLYILLITAFLFAGKILVAQTYNFKTYTEDDGLPQSYIYCISQNSKGFLYLSTGDGFCEFGGTRFTNYTIRDSLAENFINTHYTDSRGITWIGHFQSGVSYRKGTKFFKLKGTEKLETKIISFAEDNKKNVWYVAQQVGIFKVDSAFKIDSVNTGLGSAINSICFDSDDNLLAATNEGLFLFRTDNPKKPVKVCPVNGLADKNIKFIISADSAKTVFWAAVPGEGVFKVQKTGSCYQVVSKISSALGSQALSISALFSDNSQNLWVALNGEGLRKISFSDKNVNGSFFITQINRQNGLGNEYIQSIFQDFEGNMWFGTMGGGLIEMPMNKFNYYSSRHGQEQDNIKCILIDSKTRAIWLGHDKGMSEFNLQNSNENARYDAANGFVNDEVNALMQDSTGFIWIGTNANGIFTFDPITKKFENFSKKNKLPAIGVNSIAQTKNGFIIFGTTEGVYMYQVKTGKTTVVTTIEGLLHNNVQQIFVDKQKRTWFSSHGAVPYYLKNDEFTYLKNIPAFNINSVTQDNDGLIWIATEGDGVYSYNGGEFKNYKVDEGLLSNFCYFIIADKNNAIWVGHKNGLSKKPVTEKIFKRFTKADGLIFPENNVNSCFSDAKGNVWFGTSSGIVNYDCEVNRINMHEPRTSIVGIRLNNQNINQFYSPDQEIILPYGYYSATIDFIGISLVDASKVNYKYRLLGLDSLWRYTSERSKEFPKITEGTYVFQLMACNNDGVWNSKPVEIEFEISIPFYKKTWIQVLSGAILILLVYLVVLWRTRSLVRARELLRRLVEEKTVQLKEEKEIVENIKSVLEEKNKDITDSINYAKRIQEAILPSQAAILKNFPDSFIYYRPKDIVSGDFYWFAEVEDYFFIAAVDCTGHGIPGAFMSLIASTLLNEIVKNKREVAPSQILQNLNNGIIESLKQNESDSSSRDGMDMAICRVDKKKSKLVFAGAARPFYHIRNKNLTEIKGQGYPIGGHYGLMNLKYSDSEIDLQKGDVFYISSDGYADQFKGGDKKKFSTKRLKMLLQEISIHPMEKQQTLLNEAFESWRVEEKQIDDILIVGIRV